MGCMIACVILLFLSLVSAVPNDHQDKQVYVVYMGSLPSQPDYLPMSHHMNILREITGESSMEGRLLRSYQRSFNGFAARLSESERELVSKMDGVVSVFPSQNFQLQTTTSWNFMGLKEGNETKRNLTVESDTIIGVFDSGITPESDSFSGKGFGPIPKKWKGVCSGGKNFTCNNKLIGVKDYSQDYTLGGRDNVGHGTHTASTAAGNVVPYSSFYGIGNGTARGAVPAARIAAYKVCSSTRCTSEDILSAFDDAIADGVDLITISIGGLFPTNYQSDTISIGAFHAMAKGILTLHSAGNNGPYDGSVTSLAPWIFSVAASTTNRGFLTKVILGNNKTLLGKSVNSFDLKGKKYPLLYGKSIASKSCDEESAQKCLPNCLDPSLVKGNILVCSSPYNLKKAKEMGAIGAIIQNFNPDVATVESFPVSALSEDDFKSLVSYIETSASPQATVLKSETIFNQTAPKIASFSSRGPNRIVADLLKPDITAPGVEILAAYSPEASVSEDDTDTRRVKYSVLSGTSMSCPHVAGVAAYVKTFHPTWSPSMIKSAIMTTAWPMNASETGIASTEFAYGSGHVDPIAAVNPGLVYESNKADHISFLCGLNFNSTNLKLIAGEPVNCSKKTPPRNLNYPSMSAKLSKSKGSFTITFTRTVTNAGTPNSTYKSNVVLKEGSKLNVKVSPSVLSFKTVNEKKSFRVIVSGNEVDPNLPSSANLIWSDKTHNVRSPIVIYTYTN